VTEAGGIVDDEAAGRGGQDDDHRQASDVMNERSRRRFGPPSVEHVGIAAISAHQDRLTSIAEARR
jgi:hypothetical protein